ncbi:MAG: AgmX/PglI C-terminal domain-containing protein [Deltaproteobacteria bacterium]|nr:AgmX/PglI C-terminal domain-containing protein [Deltaproteobacteria bacterium]
MATSNALSSRALVAGASLLSMCLGLALACGNTPAAADPKSAGASGGAPGAEGSSAAAATGGPGSSGGATGAGGATTTTTALPGNNGDLQGAKLASATHTETETKGDGGPKAGPGHQQEPGRKREDIQTIVMSHRDEARACYDKGLQKHPGIEGDLVMSFKIDPEGKVVEAAMDTSKSSITEKDVGDCIADVIKKIKFAKSPGGFETRANYPFNFHPKQFSKDAGAK